MLGGLFPNLFGGNDSGATSLASGSTPENLNGTERTNLSTYSILPTKVTQDNVNQAAKVAGELEGQTVLLREASQQYDAVQKAALANLQVRVDHGKKAMTNEKEFRKKMAQHGKNIYEYRVGTEAVQQNMDGYESQFQAAKDSVKF